MSLKPAESVLEHAAVDVVLSDLGLPGMDGAATGSPPPGTRRCRPG